MTRVHRIHAPKILHLRIILVSVPYRNHVWRQSAFSADKKVLSRKVSQHVIEEPYAVGAESLTIEEKLKVLEEMGRPGAHQRVQGVATQTDAEKEVKARH